MPAAVATSWAGSKVRSIISECRTIVRVTRRCAWLARQHRSHRRSRSAPPLCTAFAACLRRPLAGLLHGLGCVRGGLSRSHAAAAAQRRPLQTQMSGKTILPLLLPPPLPPPLPLNGQSRWS